MYAPSSGSLYVIAGNGEVVQEVANWIHLWSSSGTERMELECYSAGIEGCDDIEVRGDLAQYVKIFSTSGCATTGRVFCPSDSSYKGGVSCEIITQNGASSELDIECKGGWPGALWMTCDDSDSESCKGTTVTCGVILNNGCAMNYSTTWSCLDTLGTCHIPSSSPLFDPSSSPNKGLVLLPPICTVPRLTIEKMDCFEFVFFFFFVIRPHQFSVACSSQCAHVVAN